MNALVKVVSLAALMCAALGLSRAAAQSPPVPPGVPATGPGLFGTEWAGKLTQTAGKFNDAMGEALEFDCVLTITKFDKPSGKFSGELKEKEKAKPFEIVYGVTGDFVLAGDTYTVTWKSDLMISASVNTPTITGVEYTAKVKNEAGAKMSGSWTVKKDGAELKGELKDFEKKK